MSLFEKLWEFKNQLPETVIHATLKKDVEAVDIIDHLGAGTASVLRRIPKGTKVRIWMISRFGDAGITDNLTDKACGYCARIGSWPGEKLQARNPGELEDYLGDVTINPKQSRSAG